MVYLTLKWIHIVSSTILFGAGLGSAFHVFMAHRRKNNAAIRSAMRTVVIADWIFTTPAVIVQFLTGLALVHLGGHSFEDTWLKIALALFFFIGICWIPVVWLQIKMRNLCNDQADLTQQLPPTYWKLERWWIILGCLAFPSVVVIFWLMVFKPA